MPPTVVAVDPLYDPPSGAGDLVEVAHRYGRYRLYAEHERIEIDLGRGLMQRHDSVQAFLRSGGARGPAADVRAAAARTSYFREEYAYGTRAHIGGVESFLHNPRLVEGAVAVHGRPVVEPAIAFANLMVPGQELAVHTDVPEFRGANRKLLPQWLLVVMHHSGLFDRWRLHIATGIAWFQDRDDGRLRYWPGGPDGDPAVHMVRANTALVLDTDSVFHGVDPVAPEVDPPIVAPGAGLVAGPDGRWALSDADGTPVADYGWDGLWFSVSWKAYCFADEAERRAWRDHTDDLTTDAVVRRLVDDLVSRDRVAPDVPVDRALGLAMIDEYVRYPGAPAPA
ncbi:MAG TPA: hypothetical protein VFI47_16865 [Acidimicrobiales bacterium]|nr:hypothetical protein [Acidimicrobiales bacterium]